MTRKPSAEDQFTALGLTDRSAWTAAMQLAVKQKWSGLQLDTKVADLRSALAAVVTPTTPDVTALLEADPTMSPDAAAAEAKRLKRNAAVNAWRERGQLQAALDARDLKFAALRAKRGTKVAAPADAVSGDDLAVAV